MAQRAVIDPYPNNILPLLPRFSRLLYQCFIILFFFAFLLGSLTSSSHAQGYPSGRPIVGTSTNVLGPSPMFFDAAQFTGTDPCNQIANAIAASNTGSPLGTEIDAAGLNAVAVAGNLPPCIFQTANFLAGAIGGRVKLGGYTMWVPFIPSAYGNVNSPPAGIIAIPSGHAGLEGIGRGTSFAPFVNTTISVCAASITAKLCPSPNSPVIRAWTVASTSLTQVTLTSPFSGHRNYMTITATPASVPATVTGITLQIVTVQMSSNVSGMLSAGQTIVTSGFAPAGYNGTFTVGDGTGGTVAPLTNSSGVTVFTFNAGASLGACTTCSGSVAVGMNLVPGEFIQIAGNSLLVNLNNDGTWRVCARAATNGTLNDPNCPVAAPNATSVGIVGTSSDQNTNFLGAVSTSACTSGSGNCGMVYGQIPIIDLGNSPQNFQYATRVMNLSLSCQGVPSCSGIRNQDADEQSGAQWVKVDSAPLWCWDVHSTFNQNSQNWHDLECLSSFVGTSGKLTPHCPAGMTGGVFGDVGPRNFDGWTVNFNGCDKGAVPIAGMYIDANSISHIANGHAENVQFDRIWGQNSPAQGVQSMNNGAQTSASCNNLVNVAGGGGSSTAGIGCANNDGPYAFATTTTAAVGAGVATIPVSSSAGCQFNTTLGVGMLVTIGTVSGPDDIETLQLMTAPGGGTLTTTTNTLKSHAMGASVWCSWSEGDGISGNFPLGIGAMGTGAFTGDYAMFGLKKNTGAVLTVGDDYAGFVSQDGFIGKVVIDTNGSGGFITRDVSSNTVPSIYPGGLSSFRPVQPKTASYTVLYSDSDTILTNGNATTAVTLTLPTCNATNAGAHFYFVQDNSTQTLTVSSPQRVRWGNYSNLAGQSFSSTVVGAMLGLQCYQATADSSFFEWLVTYNYPVTAWTFNATANPMPYNAQVVRLATDYTTTTAVLEKFLSLGNIQTAVLNYSFACHLSYSQGTAIAMMSLGVQSTTSAPTNIYAAGTLCTSLTTACTNGTLPLLNTTTATPVVSATPSNAGSTFIFTAEMWGTLETAGTGVSALNFMVSTATAADAITVKRGSYCELFNEQ